MMVRHCQGQAEVKTADTHYKCLMAEGYLECKRLQSLNAKGHSAQSDLL